MLWTRSGMSSGVGARFSRRLAIWVSAAAVFGVISACSDRTLPTENHPADLTTIVIAVEGMACVACAASVKRALTSVDGVAEVEVNLAERNARVRFDATHLAPDALVAAIDQLGYRAGIPVETR
jgi:P-type Cu+ transporter